MKRLYTDLDPFCCAVLRARVADGGLPPGEVWERDIKTLTADELRPFTQVHLFAGIGGSALGLKWAGWPDDWSIVTGGFPCQPVSVAGKGLAQADDRWLWPEMHRVIDIVRPDWVIAENVPGLRTRGVDLVLGDMERSGYGAWALVVGADDVGAPHRRKRVWVVGMANTLRDDGRGPRREARRGRGVSQTGELDNADGVRRNQQPASRVASEPNRNGAHDGLPKSSGSMDNPTSARCAGDTGCQPTRKVRNKARGEETAGLGCNLADAPRGGLGADGAARESCGHADERGENLEHAPVKGLEGRRERLSGQTGWRWPLPPGPEQHDWEAPRLTQSGVGVATDGVSRRLAGFARRNALKALGNSQVPAVVELVARAMMAT